MKAKNLRLRRLIPAVLIAVILLGAVRWMLPKRFLKNVRPENVACIKVFDGTTGREIIMTDPEEIAWFIAAVSQVPMKKTKLSLGYYGYSFRVTVEMDGPFRIAPRQFIINSGDTIRQGLFFWQSTGGSLPFEWLRNYPDP